MKVVIKAKEFKRVANVHPKDIIRKSLKVEKEMERMWEGIFERAFADKESDFVRFIKKEWEPKYIDSCAEPDPIVFVRRLSR